MLEMIKVFPVGKDIYIKGAATDDKGPTLRSLVCGCKAIRFCLCLKLRENSNRTLVCRKEKLCFHL